MAGNKKLRDHGAGLLKEYVDVQANAAGERYPTHAAFFAAAGGIAQDAIDSGMARFGAAALADTVARGTAAASTTELGAATEQAPGCCELAVGAAKTYNCGAWNGFAGAHLLKAATIDGGAKKCYNQIGAVYNAVKGHLPETARTVLELVPKALTAVTDAASTVGSYICGWWGCRRRRQLAAMSEQYCGVDAGIAIEALTQNLQSLAVPYASTADANGSSARLRRSQANFGACPVIMARTSRLFCKDRT